MTPPANEFQPASDAPAVAAEAADSPWRGLYRVGGAAALISAALLPIQMVVFVVWPPPLEGAALDWFAVFQQNALRGLLSLDLLLIVDYVLLIPIFLALYVALRRYAPSLMALAVGLEMVAITVYFPSNPAFEMLSLSRGYAAPAGDAERAAFLAAGQAMVVGWTGTAFNVSHVLASVAGILVPFAMLRSGIFGRAAAYTGLVGNVLGIGLFLPSVGIFLALLSVVVLWVWYVLIGRTFLRLGRGASTARP